MKWLRLSNKELDFLNYLLGEFSYQGDKIITHIVKL